MNKRLRPALIISVLAVAFTSVCGSAGATPTTVGTTATQRPADPPYDSGLARNQDQLVVIDQLRRIVDKYPDEFVGVSAPTPGRVVVNLADNGATAHAEFKTIRTAAEALGLVVELAHQPHSLAELRAISARITEKDELGVAKLDRLGVSIDPGSDSVVVSVSSPNSGLRDKAQGLYGDRVKIDTALPMKLAYGRFNDSPAFYGGDRIANPSGTCTYGFSITNLYGQEYGLTAGHCWPVGAGVSVTRYFYCAPDAQTCSNSGTGYDNFGTVQYRRFGGGQIDMELIGGRYYGGRVWTGSSLQDDGSHSAPVHQAGRSSSANSVWFDGSFTGMSLAVVDGDAGCQTIEGDYICGLWLAHSQTGARICQGGDSGGPVFAYDGRGGVTAVGIIDACTPDGQYGYYSDVPDILSYWQSTITTG